MCLLCASTFTWHRQDAFWLKLFAAILCENANSAKKTKIEMQLGESACWCWYGKKAPNHTPHTHYSVSLIIFSVCVCITSTMCAVSRFHFPCACIYSKPLNFQSNIMWTTFWALPLYFCKRLFVAKTVSNTIRMHGNNYFYAFRFNWPNFQFYSLFENSNDVVRIVR